MALRPVWDTGGSSGARSSSETGGCTRVGCLEGAGDLGAGGDATTRVEGVCCKRLTPFNGGLDCSISTVVRCGCGSVVGFLGTFMEVFGTTAGLNSNSLLGSFTGV